MSEQPDIPLQQNVWLSEQGESNRFFLVAWGFFAALFLTLVRLSMLFL